MASKTKHLSTRQSLKLIAFIVAIVLIITGCGYYHHVHQWRALGPVETTGNSALATSQKFAQRDQLSYEIYYRESCPDCRQLQKHHVPYYFHQNLPRSIQVMVFDDGPHFKKTPKSPTAKPNSTTLWLRDNYITAVPSIIVKYHGYPIYMYSGTRVSIWTKLGRGINPMTNKRFTKRVPKREIVQNSFDHSTTSYLSVKIKDIDNNQFEVN